MGDEDDPSHLPIPPAFGGLRSCSAGFAKMIVLSKNQAFSNDVRWVDFRGLAYLPELRVHTACFCVFSFRNCLLTAFDQKAGVRYTRHIFKFAF